MDLLDKIQDLIRETMSAEYVSGMKVEINGVSIDKCSSCPQNFEDEYNLYLDLNQWRAPLILSYQGTQDGFLQYLKREFKSRQLTRTRYYTGIQTDPGLGNQFIIFDYGPGEGSCKN